MWNRHISEAEMRELLRDAYAQDSETSFRAHLGRCIADPLKGPGKSGFSLVHPVVLALAAATLFSLAVFICFCFIDAYS
jgi:hypothetical protein